MRLRCDLTVNEGKRRLVLVPYESETRETLALRLAAMVLFFDDAPVAELSAKHPALADQEYRPDCVALDESGRVKLWVEAGKTTANKLDKVTRRYPDAKIVVLTANEHHARQMRQVVDDKVPRSKLLEIWSFRKDDFRQWHDALREDTYVVGEADGISLNLVINDVPLAVDLVKF
ncbi:MAG: YaeQ family protein [Elusimicrobia bacterium]|nr:YaeQ family protein [Elusimicrobiota bacterium]